MAVVEIALVRHGLTMLNVAKRIQGWSDAPLTKEGGEVAGRLGQGLKASGIRFDSAFASDTTRSVQTATIILDQAGQPELASALRTDWRLRELNFGSHEGMDGASLFSLLARASDMTVGEYSKWVAQNEHEAVVHLADTISRWDAEKDAAKTTWPAEDYRTFQGRIRSALYSIAEDALADARRRTLVVSHSLSIGAALSAVGASDLLPSKGFANASVTTVAFDGNSFSVQEVNDTSWIQEGS